MFDLAALGEILIDFTPGGTNETGMRLFSRNPGGAPANVLVMAGKLGAKTAFIGKVGSDPFGSFLKETLQNEGVDVSGMVVSQEVPTTLAFVQLDEKGDRTFSFYRNPGADVCLRADEVDETILNRCGVFHFGSVSLTDEPSRTATLESVKKAKKAGAVVSYDPNYRPALWREEILAVQEMTRALELADIVKTSEEELLLLTGESDLEKGSRKLLERGPVLAVVTRGPKGAYYRAGSVCGSVSTFDVPTVDTTGAGDAFWGALLSRLCGKKREDLSRMTREELEQAVIFANAAGSLATMKKGAIPSLPTREEIEACIRETPRFASV